MLGVPQTLEYFQRMQDRITSFVAENSNITPERFYELSMNTEELVMDVGTVLDGEDAVKEADRPAGKFVGRAPVPLRHDR